MPLPIIELEKLDYRIPVWESEELHERPCPLCDSEDRLQQFRRPDRLVVNLCRCCGLYYVSPAPSGARLDRFYSEYWATHKDGNDFPKNSRTVDAISREYENQVPFVELASLLDFRDKNVLDIGCGAGMFLYTASRKGANVFGVDPDSDAVNYASNVLGMSEVQQGDIFRYSLESREKYDLVVMNDFFEHPLAIGSVLRHAMELVVPGGFLAILTPNGTAFIGHDSPTGLRVDLEHMQYMTREALHFILREHPGWNIAHYEEVGFPFLAALQKPSSFAKKTLTHFLKMVIPPSFVRVIRGILSKGGGERNGNYHLFTVLRKPVSLDNTGE